MRVFLLSLCLCGSVVVTTAQDGPPRDPKATRAADLVELVKLDPSIKLDIRYAGAYRPWAITKLFWDMTSGFQREFVADPKTGSKHNRGCAVDLTIYDLATGRAVAMPGGYDEMTPRSYPTYPGGPPEARAKRDLLRKVMESHGFTVEPNEWWHFNYRDWQLYPILDIAFAAIQ